jgi:hypothetical protein
MEPHSQKYLNRDHSVYKYRLYCAQLVVENVFGILAGCFRVFLKTINLSPEKVKIILVCFHLHNNLRD